MENYSWAIAPTQALEIARMKLEYGKRYVTKSGWITPPMFMNTPDEDFPFYAGSPDLKCGVGQHSWDASGRYFGSGNDEADIASEYVDRSPSTVHEGDILAAMEEYGGSFVKGLAGLYRKADSENQDRLKEAFSFLWARYTEVAQSKNRGA